MYSRDPRNMVRELKNKHTFILEMELNSGGPNPKISSQPIGVLRAGFGNDVFQQAVKMISAVLITSLLGSLALLAPYCRWWGLFKTKQRFAKG